MPPACCSCFPVPKPMPDGSFPKNRLLASGSQAQQNWEGPVHLLRCRQQDDGAS